MFSASSASLILFISIIIFNSLGQASIFSSLIRNNLNRYLKNPLFTKSFVRNSYWQGGESGDEHGSMVSPLLASHPSEIHLNEFIKSQNMLSQYGPYNFAETIPTRNNDFNHLIALPSKSPSPQLDSNLNEVPMKYLNKKIDDSTDFFGANPKTSILQTSNHINAYSDSQRINSFSNKNHSSNQIQKPNQSNLYVGDATNDHRPASNVATSINRVHFPNHPKQQPKKINNNHYQYHKKMKNNLSNGRHKSNSKYNQEKALNLKLEYGFKPLPTRKDNDNAALNSVQPSDSLESNDEDTEELDRAESKDKPLDDSPYNRSMKSIMDQLTMSQQSNHLDELSSDYKKYMSYPMETESSDVHKLAFTGVESFRPDHGYLALGFDKNYPSLNTIANYPNIKNFKKQGIDCAHQSTVAAYCEYDSSYPIDYINSIITNCTSIIDDMYIEMPENMNDFSGYKSLFRVHQNDHANNDGYDQTKNKSLCESERKYIRPSVIKDVHDNYHVILQSSFYFQQVPVEICLKPGSACNYIGRCNGQVKCRQKYRTHLLISIDHVEENQHQNMDYFADKPPAANCPKMRMYRLPSACACELSAD